MTPASAAAALAEELQAAEAALERGDPPAAAQAVLAAARTCAAAEAAGVRLDPADLARLTAQHGRLQARAAQTHQALAAQLEGAGRSRRAAVAYGRR